MTFDEIVNARYSVRCFDPERPVSDGQITAMCGAARLAPSAVNSQTWRFIAVRDRDRIRRLCGEGMGPVIRNRFVMEAPLVIVGCARLDFITNTVGTRITGIEYYLVDMGIAMEHLVLKATELGLGTCWVGWINEENIRAILGIPKNVRVVALVAVGYPKAPKTPEHSRKPLEKILFSETWGGRFG